MKKCSFNFEWLRSRHNAGQGRVVRRGSADGNNNYVSTTITSLEDGVLSPQTSTSNKKTKKRTTTLCVSPFYTQRFAHACGLNECQELRLHLISPTEPFSKTTTLADNSRRDTARHWSQNYESKLIATALRSHRCLSVIRHTDGKIGGLEHTWSSFPKDAAQASKGCLRVRKLEKL